MSGNPPERGLWRELLDLAVGTVRRFDLGGRTWPASAVWSVGATLYLSADKAGMRRHAFVAGLKSKRLQSLNGHVGICWVVR